MAVGIHVFSASILQRLARCGIVGSTSVEIALICRSIGAIMRFNSTYVVKLRKCNKKKARHGFKILDFEFYDEKNTNGKLRLVLELLCGIIVGAVMSCSKALRLIIPLPVWYGVCYVCV